MIVTVTPNPAVDVTYTLPTVTLGATNRARECVTSAGGKGVNVARVLRALDEPVLALGLAGGRDGDLLGAELDRAGVPRALTPIAGCTRRTVTLVSTVDARATIVNEPGPAVSAAEWGALRAAVGERAAGASVVVLSGSLPAGAPVDGFAQLLRIAAAHGTPTILDTSGSALAAGVVASPTVLKPNAEELRELAPGPPAVAAAELARRHACAVVVSCGAGGLLAVTGAGTHSARPVEHVAGNPVGAGDACVAALAAGLAAGVPVPRSLSDAVALSAAAVRCAAAGEVDTDYYRAHRGRARTEEGSHASGQCG